MTRYTTEIKWAFLFFILTLAWMLFEKMLGWHGSRISEHATYSFFYDALFIAIFMMAFRDKKRHFFSGDFTWKHGFIFGLHLTIIIALLSPITQTIVHKIISPEYFPNIIDLAIENQLLSREAAEARFNLRSYMVQNTIGTFLLGLLTTVFMAILFRHRKLNS